ncbi:MAG: SusC/RagA family TonB-linked outer membrane protein [Odoribacteraceae bacterium]|jgi:TonB-linked SusC/RagA family outer membrane protein|nr:SusC/RagA family TonB-linked outer membrane protein [Odoribacteraceae bacterium]
MKQFLLIIILGTILASPLVGQVTGGRVEVTGVVTDAKTGETLPGVSVSVKGTTNGVITDGNGRYRLLVADGNAVLRYSFIGRATREEPVGNRRVINVALAEAATLLDEVVVTALGVTRENRTLGFSVQQVEGAMLLEARESNLLNGLNDRVAGVRITNPAGGIGASANIQIRGQNFVSGYNYNNSPLFVVDGVPVSNNNEQSTRAFTGRQDFNNPNFTSGEGEVDYGNAAAEIDPHDIESISILKGPNAAALYGSRASNGVVLITTKSGKGARGIGVSFSSSFMLESPLVLPDYQYRYGQGRDGRYAYADGAGGGVNDNIIENWGPPMDGRLVAQWDSPVDPATGQRVPTPFVAHPDQLKEFFVTGHTATNNLSVIGGDERHDFRASYTNMTQRGIVPNTDMTRNSLGVNAGYSITPALKFSANVNYVQSTSDNRTSYGAKNEDAIMHVFLYMPRNVDVKKLRDYWQEGSGGTRQATPMWSANGARLNNPYFVAHENLNGNKRERLFGHVKLDLDILPGLHLLLRSGRDFYVDKRTMRHAVSSAQHVNGYYQEDDVSFLETNHDFLLTYARPPGLDLTFSASAGGSLTRQRSERLGAIAPRLAIPGVYNLTNNATAIVAGNSYQEKRVNSLYGTVQVGYKNALFLDLTGRNDWSSALPRTNRSYFYPSASLSAVLTELLGAGNRSTFVKARASVASVRRDLEPYQTSTNFQISQGWGGETVAVHNNNYPNANIRPENVLAYEFGIDARLPDGRVVLDATFYKSITTDLIIPVTLNPSAGYDTKLMNVGKMTNRGIEVMLGLTPVRTRDFRWKATLNYAANRNRVNRLAEQEGVSRIRQLERWASLELRTENTKDDGSFGSLYGDYLIYNENKLTHRNGFPQEENGDWGYLGNVNPRWTGSLDNEFRYKALTASFLFSVQRGGAVYSRTYIEGIRAGSLKESLVNRNADGAGNMIGEGTDVDTGAANATTVTTRDYWRAYYDNDRSGTFDASHVKLREARLAYRLPASLLERLSLVDGVVSLVGRNLLLWTKVPNIDPEVSSYDGQLQGIETMSLPSLRSYGLSLHITF